MKKKTKRILIVVGSVLGCLVIAAGVCYAVITAKYERARAEAEAQIHLMDQLAVEDRAIPIAEEYGVTDLTIETLRESNDSLACCTFTSEQFGTLDDKDKLLLLADLGLEFYRDSYVFSKQSPLYGDTVYLDLKYNGDYYSHGSENSLSYLLINGNVHKEVSMWTEYASMISANLNGLLNTDVNGNRPRRSSGRTGTGETCPVCNGSGYVRYYSANSALESLLEGVPAYTTGPCTSCNGTGRR